MKTTKRRMSAFLPPTPCTPELREKVTAFAEQEGRSIADVQRDAISVFLSRYEMERVNNDTLSKQEQTS